MSLICYQNVALSCEVTLKEQCHEKSKAFLNPPHLIFSPIDFFAVSIFAPLYIYLSAGRDLTNVSDDNECTVLYAHSKTRPGKSWL